MSIRNAGFRAVHPAVDGMQRSVFAHSRRRASAAGQGRHSDCRPSHAMDERGFAALIVDALRGVSIKIRL